MTSLAYSCVVVFLLSCFFLETSSRQPPLSPLEVQMRILECSIGMKSGKIRNNQIRASSYWHNLLSHAPFLARIDNQGAIDSTGSWSSGTNEEGQWIEVDLLEPTRIEAVVTQGRPGSLSVQWVKSYQMWIGNETGALKPIMENGKAVIYQGNDDINTPVINYLRPDPIIARRFRLRPMDWKQHMSLRMDLLTC